MRKRTYGASYLITTKNYETPQLTHLSRYIRHLFITISNFSKPKQSLLMNEIEREPCQQREDIEKMCLDDFLTEHEYQQVSTPRSCEIRSFKTDVYETVPVSKASGRPPLPTSESTEGYETLTRKGRSNQCPLPTPETTRDYENLPTYRKSKRPTLPIPSNTGLAANDTHAKGHARLLETTI